MQVENLFSKFSICIQEDKNQGYVKDEKTQK
jgi:hypothetical protein